MSDDESGGVWVAEIPGSSFPVARDGLTDGIDRLATEPGILEIAEQVLDDPASYGAQIEDVVDMLSGHANPVGGQKRTMPRRFETQRGDVQQVRQVTITYSGVHHDLITHASLSHLGWRFPSGYRFTESDIDSYVRTPTERSEDLTAILRPGSSITFSREVLDALHKDVHPHHENYVTIGQSDYKDPHPERNIVLFPNHWYRGVSYGMLSWWNDTERVEWDGRAGIGENLRENLGNFWDTARSFRFPLLRGIPGSYTFGGTDEEVIVMGLKYGLLAGDLTIENRSVDAQIAAYMDFAPRPATPSR